VELFYLKKGKTLLVLCELHVTYLQFAPQQSGRGSLALWEHVLVHVKVFWEADVVWALDWSAIIQPDGAL